MIRPRARRSWIKKLFAFVVAAWIQVPSAGSALAQYSQILTPDARARGMGTAYTTIAEGGSAAWWNPGALGLLDRISLTFHSRMDYDGVFEGGKTVHRSFGASGRVRAVGYGAHLNHVSSGEVVLTDRQGTPVGKFKPRDFTLVMGVGTDLLPILHLRSKAIALGVGSNLRLVHYNAPPAKLTLDGRSHSATAWDFDLGALGTARLPFVLRSGGAHRGASYAAVRLGVVQTAVFHRQIGSTDGDRADLERSRRTGGAVEVAIAEVPPFGCLLRAIYALERHKEFLGESAYDVWGLEVTLLDILSIRTGRIDDPDRGYVVDTHGYGVGFHINRAFGARLDAVKHRRGVLNEDLRMYTLSISVDPEVLSGSAR